MISHGKMKRFAKIEDAPHPPFFCDFPGFKRIKPVALPDRIDPGPSLRERLELQERKREQMNRSPPPNPDWLDYEAVADKFDKIDHLIDLHGHIVGMGLSPDHR